MKYLLSIFIALVLVSCGKNPNEIKVIDFLSADSIKYKEQIQKEWSFNSIDSIHIALGRYDKSKKIDSIKDFTLRWLIDDYKSYQKALEPRKKIYDHVVAELKSSLKFPETAEIPELELYDTEDYKVLPDTLRDASYKKVIMNYNAKNGFGVLSSGIFECNIKLDAQGNPKTWFKFSY